MFIPFSSYRLVNKDWWLSKPEIAEVYAAQSQKNYEDLLGGRGIIWTLKPSGRITHPLPTLDPRGYTVYPALSNSRRVSAAFPEMASASNENHTVATVDLPGVEFSPIGICLLPIGNQRREFHAFYFDGKWLAAGILADCSKECRRCQHPVGDEHFGIWLSFCFEANALVIKSGHMCPSCNHKFDFGLKLFVPILGGNDKK